MIFVTVRRNASDTANEGNSCGRPDQSFLGPLDLPAFDVLDQTVHEMPDPRVVASLPLESELLAQDELQRAVVEPVELRIGDPEVLVQGSARVGPFALEPPGVRTDREAAKSFQCGQATRRAEAWVGESPAPDRRRLGARQRLAARDRWRRLPCDPQLPHETGPRGERDVFLVWIARGEKQPAPGAARDDVEQPAFVLQTKAIAFRLRPWLLEEAEVEHGLG